MARLDENLTQAELVVAGAAIARAVREVSIAGGVRRIGLDHGLCFHPSLVRGSLWVQPVVHEDQFAICLGFVSQAVLSSRAWSLEGDLLSTYAVDAVARAEVSMKFEATEFLLHSRNLRLSFLQQLIGGHRGYLSLKIGSHLGGVSEQHLVDGVLGCEFCGGDCRFCLFRGCFFLLFDLLLKNGDPLLHLLRGLFVLLLKLLELLLEIVGLLSRRGEKHEEDGERNPRKPSRVGSARHHRAVCPIACVNSSFAWAYSSCDCSRSVCASNS